MCVLEISAALINLQLGCACVQCHVHVAGINSIGNDRQKALTEFSKQVKIVGSKNTARHFFINQLWTQEFTFIPVFVLFWTCVCVCVCVCVRVFIWGGILNIIDVNKNALAAVKTRMPCCQNKNVVLCYLYANRHLDLASTCTPAVLAQPLSGCVTLPR